MSDTNSNSSNSDKKEEDSGSDSVTDVQHVEKMANTLLEQTQPSVKALSDMLLEMQWSQRELVRVLGVEQASFDENAKSQMAALTATFDKIPAYQAKLTKINKQMRMLKDRVRQLKHKSNASKKQALGKLDDVAKQEKAIAAQADKLKEQEQRLEESQLPSQLQAKNKQQQQKQQQQKQQQDKNQ